MKTKLIIIGLAAVIRVQADTNFFEILTCGDTTYTNATIGHVTPSYATVTFAGGIVQVPLRDLPENLQQQYHYNSNAAAQFLLEKKHKSDELRAKTTAQQIAYEKAMAAMAGQSKNIQITSIIDETSNGGYPLCSVGYGGGGGGGGGGNEHPIPGRILLRNMPAEVREFLRVVQQLKSDIATLESQPITVTANSTVYNPDGTVDQFGSQLASQSAASDAYYQAKEAKREKLEQMKSKLEKLEDSQWDHTTVRAYPTGQTFGGYEIWTCTGMAPQNSTSP
jgi:hypothetical protein